MKEEQRRRTDGVKTAHTAIDDFADHLRWERGLSPHTVRGYVGDLHQLREWSRLTVAELVEQLSLPLVREWMAAAVEDGASRSSMARRSAALRAWGGWLERTGRVPNNPVARLSYPRTGSVAPRVLSAAAVADALDIHTPQTPIELRDSAILETLYAGGLRVAELCFLDVDDVDLEQGLATVTGKGSKQRRVPLGVPCVDALQRWMRRGRPAMIAPASGPALFVGVRGGRIDQRQVRTVVQAYSGRRDPSRAVSPHALRHAAATHMLDGGADIRTVQEFLGHSSLASTQIYTHVSADRLRQSYIQAHPRA